LLVALVVASDLFEVEFGGGFTMKMVDAPLVAAALLLPPGLAAVCALAVGFGTPWTLRWQHRIFNASNHALATALAAAAAGAVGLGGGTRFAVAGCAAVGVFWLVTNGLVALMVRAAADEEAMTVAEQLSRRILLPQATLASIGVVLAWLWLQNAALLPLALLPLVLMWDALHVTKLKDEARRDSKTGLANARRFQEALDEEVRQARRSGRPLSLLMCDLDYLRDINNTHGHVVGDEVLQGIGEVLRTAVRSSDVAARFGGEEFCILLPSTGLERAESLAERVREAVAARAYGGNGVHATMSVGVASFPQHARDGVSLVTAADEAVYAAKAAGRNTVRTAALS
jgi:diguanylate cyclase (GGDEF)-like protein